METTALIMAAAKGHAVIVTALLVAGAQPELETEKGATALSFAAREGHAECVAVLAEGGADIDRVTGAGSTALIEAVATERAAVCTVLLEHGASTAVTNAEGTTALMLSAQFGVLEIVKLLLENGADAAFAGAKGLTPLVLAAQNGHVAVCGALLAKGAELGAQAERGDTALHMAAQQGHAEVLQLLLDHGAAERPHSLRCNGQTALHVAAAWGQLRCAEVLLAAGFELDAVDEDGDDCVALARGAEQEEVASALEQRKRFLQVTPEHKAAAATLKDAANERFRDGDFASAVAMYRMAAQTDPSSAVLPGNIAAALLKMEDFAGAEEAAASAVAIDSGNEKALYRLGQARHGLGKYDDAVQAFAAALALNPRLREAKRGAAKAARSSVERHDAAGTSPPQATLVYCKALARES